MSNNDCAWLRYADLQERRRKAQYSNDFSWGIESALNYLLSAIETGTVPPNPEGLDSSLARTIASGARLYRSRSSALKKWVRPPQSVSTYAAAEAKIELSKIGSAVKEADETILIETGLGYTDREIANRHASTPGAIRVRLSRLRTKLVANSRPQNASLRQRQSRAPDFWSSYTKSVSRKSSGVTLSHYANRKGEKNG